MWSKVPWANGGKPTATVPTLPDVGPTLAGYLGYRMTWFCGYSEIYIQAVHWEFLDSIKEYYSGYLQTGNAFYIRRIG